MLLPPVLHLFLDKGRYVCSVGARGVSVSGWEREETEALLLPVLHRFVGFEVVGGGFCSDVVGLGRGEVRGRGRDCLFGWKEEGADLIIDLPRHE